MRRAWYASSNVWPAGGPDVRKLIDRGALVGEERATEARDEAGEDLALVDVVRARVRSRGLGRSARRAPAGDRSARGAPNCS